MADCCSKSMSLSQTAPRNCRGVKCLEADLEEIKKPLKEAETKDEDLKRLLSQ